MDFQIPPGQFTYPPRCWPEPTHGAIIGAHVITQNPCHALKHREAKLCVPHGAHYGLLTVATRGNSSGENDFRSCVKSQRLAKRVPAHPYRFHRSELELRDSCVQFFLGKMIAVVNVAKEICARLLGIFLQAAVDARLYCVAESERRESLNFRVRARTQEDLVTPNLFRDTDNLLDRCPVTNLATLVRTGQGRHGWISQDPRASSKSVDSESVIGEPEASLSLSSDWDSLCSPSRSGAWSGPCSVAQAGLSYLPVSVSRVLVPPT